MYAPHFCVRLEVALTDEDDLHEWRIVLGGAQRGGLSARHGYLPTNGSGVIDEVEDILKKVRELVEGYAFAACGRQGMLELP